MGTFIAPAAALWESILAPDHPVQSQGQGIWRNATQGG